MSTDDKTGRNTAKGAPTFAMDSQILPRVTLSIPMPKGAAVPVKAPAPPPDQTRRTGG